jgi:hypothetical protein
MSSAICDAGAEDADEPPLGADEPPLGDAPRSTGGLMKAPVPPNLAGQHINENVIPLEDTPVARRVTEATIQLRRWIVGGLGVLTGMILLINPLLVLIRPELADFARNFLQIALTGLLSLCGTVVGFLFAREKDR